MKKYALIFLVVAFAVGCRSEAVKTFDSRNLYCIKISIGDELPRKYIMPGQDLAEVVYRYVDEQATFKEIDKYATGGKVLKIPSVRNFQQRHLAVLVKKDREVDEIYQSSGVEGLKKHFFPEGHGSVSLSRSYLAKVLLDHGIVLRFSDENATFYLKAAISPRMSLRRRQ